MTRTLIATLIAAFILLSFSATSWSQPTPQELIDRYQATDLTADLIEQHQFYQNPWKYQGQQIYFSGTYHRHINPGQAIMIVLPGKPVVAETAQDLTAWPFSVLGCVGEVLGTFIVQQGIFTREVPHIQIVECAPRSPHAHRKSARPDAGVQAYLAYVEEVIGVQWRSIPATSQASPVVTFRVEPNGTIANVAIKETSGDPGQDAAAKQIIDSVALPPFHPGMPGHLDIRYKFNHPLYEVQ